jgi:hypothetical protein
MHATTKKATELAVRNTVSEFNKVVGHFRVTWIVGAAYPSSRAAEAFGGCS